MHKMSGLDAVFLYSETPTTPMNVIATLILEGRGAREGAAFSRSDRGRRPVDYETIVARLEERLPRIPHFRRLVTEAPLGLERPRWKEIDASEIDLEQHVMRVMAREPGGREELAAVVAKAAAVRLDRSRPLWSLWVVEGLEDGKTAIVIRAHHALLDGMSGAALLAHLFDCDEETSATDPRRSPDQVCGGSAENAEPSPLVSPLLSPLISTLASPLRTLRRSTSELGRRADDSIDAARTLATNVRRVARSFRNQEFEGRAPAKPLDAPLIHLNRTLSNRRALAYSRVEASQVRKVRQSLGGTFNSVVLAGCTEALRHHLQGLGEMPRGPLIAAVPVSTRSLGDQPGGNRISAMLVRLPIHLDDPIDRFFEIRAENQLAKRFHTILGGDTLASAAELLPAGLTQAALGAYSQLGLADRHGPLANVTISTVSVPDAGFRIGGASIEAIHPHGPLMEGSALNITVMRYGSSIDIGVLACARALPDPRGIADETAAGIERLAKLARHTAR